MRLRAAIPSLILLCVNFAVAATPDPAPDASLPTFRVETAEVHVAFSAFDKHDRPVSQITSSDFMLLRDGFPVDRLISVEHRHDSPIAATVLTDVSASMSKAVPMARDSWRWLDANFRDGDEITYQDFSGDLIDKGSSREQSRQTAFYDSLLKLIPRIARFDNARRVLILFTDGRDNNSVHGLEDVIRLAVAEDVAIYAITTWKYKINYEPDILESLTSSTGGHWFAVRDTKDMQSALRDISDELRNGFEVVFRADNALAGLHRITIQPNNRRLRFYHKAAYYQPVAEASLPLVAFSR
jgi:Ca-activated chloride channel family protein